MEAAGNRCLIDDRPAVAFLSRVWIKSRLSGIRLPCLRFNVTPMQSIGMITQRNVPNSIHDALTCLHSVGIVADVE
jgi:hypothetical protein